MDCRPIKCFRKPCIAEYMQGPEARTDVLGGENPKTASISPVLPKDLKSMTR